MPLTPSFPFDNEPNLIRVFKRGASPSSINTFPLMIGIHIHIMERGRNKKEGGEAPLLKLLPPSPLGEGG